MVICLEQGADLHIAQLMPLPLTVSCFSKIQIGFTFLVPAHPDSPGKRAVKWMCVLTYLRLLQVNQMGWHSLANFTKYFSYKLYMTSLAHSAQPKLD